MNDVAKVKFADYETSIARLLGHDSRQIEYLTLANGVLGSMEDVRIVAG